MAFFNQDLYSRPWLGDTEPDWSLLPPAVPSAPLPPPPHPSPPSPSASVPYPSLSPRSQAAYAEMQELAKQRPEQPRASLWRQLAALGTGFATGYANAGGRIQPVDPTPAVRGLLYGDYDTRLANWEQDVKGARDRFNAAADTDKIGLDFAEFPIRSAFMRAQTAQMQQAVKDKETPAARKTVGSPHFEKSNGELYQILTWDDGTVESRKLDIPKEDVKKAETFRAPIAVADAVTGEEIYVQFKDDGTWSRVEGVKPISRDRDGGAGSAVDERQRQAAIRNAEDERQTRFLEMESKFDRELAALEERRNNPLDPVLGIPALPANRKPTPAEIEAYNMQKAAAERAYNAAKADIERRRWTEKQRIENAYAARLKADNIPYSPVQYSKPVSPEAAEYLRNQNR